LGAKPYLEGLFRLALSLIFSSLNIEKTRKLQEAVDQIRFGDGKGNRQLLTSGAGNSTEID
jgi:hypothetical protein